MNPSLWLGQPRLSPPAVMLANALLPQAPVHTCDGVLQWCAPPAGPLGGQLVLRAPAGAIAHDHVLRLSVSSLAVLSPLFAGPGLALDEAQRNGLLDWALAPLLQALGRTTGWPWCVADLLQPEPEAPPPVLGLRWTPSDGAAAWRMAVDADAAVLLTAAHGAGATGPEPLNWANWQRLPVPLRLRVGQVSAALTELQALAVGDVLGLSPALFWPLPRVSLVTPQGQCVARARVHNDSLWIEDLMNLNLEDETLSLTAAEGDAAPALQLSPADLRVQLSFDLATLQLPLARLNELREGSVLGLGHRIAEHRVQIRANGVTVGQGELVQLGDEVAVRLLHWSAPGS